MAVGLAAEAVQRHAAVQKHILRRGTWPNDHFDSTFALRSVFASALQRKFIWERLETLCLGSLVS
jgi:hypothetical protein